MGAFIEDILRQIQDLLELAPPVSFNRRVGKEMLCSVSEEVRTRAETNKSR